MSQKVVVFFLHPLIVWFTHIFNFLSVILYVCVCCFFLLLLLFSFLLMRYISIWLKHYVIAIRLSQNKRYTFTLLLESVFHNRAHLQITRLINERKKNHSFIHSYLLLSHLQKIKNVLRVCFNSINLSSSQFTI